MIIAEQIATYLSENSIGSYSENSTDSTIFIDSLPDGDDIISIYNKSGVKSDSKLGYFTAGIQIIYRGTRNPIESCEIADSIHELLHGFNKDYFVTGENYIVSCLSIQGSAVGIGVNKNGNFEYSLNFNVEYKV